MSLYSRPNGTSAFQNIPGMDPALMAQFDAEFNAQTAAINSLDDANISGTPPISASKVDLTSSGMVARDDPNDATRTMSRQLFQAFEGIWRTLRATGNAQVFEGQHGALWGIAYNTYWTGTVWAPAQTGAACVLWLMTATGMRVLVDTPGAGVAPSFDLASTIQFEVFDDKTIGSQGIKTRLLEPYTAGNVSLSTNVTEHAQVINDTAWTKFKETRIYGGGTLRIAFDGKSSLSAGNAQIWRNGVAVGTAHGLTLSTYQTWTEDISGWNAGDYVQIYCLGTPASPFVSIRNLNISVNEDFIHPTSLL